jgi:hypothetical protein
MISNTNLPIITVQDVRKAERKAWTYCTFNGPKSKQCRKYTDIADDVYRDFLRQFMVDDDLNENRADV